MANENYARELLELFTLGVNNGYDQNDITGDVPLLDRLVGAEVAVGGRLQSSGPGTAGVSEHQCRGLGLQVQTSDHNTTAKSIFPGKTVPARFGPPWAGRSYQITIAATTQRRHQQHSGRL